MIGHYLQKAGAHDLFLVLYWQLKLSDSAFLSNTIVQIPWQRHLWFLLHISKHNAYSNIQTTCDLNNYNIYVFTQRGRKKPLEKVNEPNLAICGRDTQGKNNTWIYTDKYLQYSSWQIHLQ